MEAAMVRVRELRLVLVTDDFEAITHLFRGVFGFETQMDLEGQGGRGVILRLPTATRELSTRITTGWSTRSRSASARETA
jgi:hypothetical protein